MKRCAPRKVEGAIRARGCGRGVASGLWCSSVTARLEEGMRPERGTCWIWGRVEQADGRARKFRHDRGKTSNFGSGETIHKDEMHR